MKSALDSNGTRLEPVADLLDVLRCLWVAMEQVDQRIRNSRPQHIGDRKTATAPWSQKPACLQLEQGLAQRRSRNVEPFRKIPFGGKQFARPQRAIHDQLLDLFADRIRKSHTTRGLDFAKWHADPTVVWSIRC